MYCQCSLARFGASSRNHGRNDDHSRGAVRPPLRGGRPAAHRGADARSADGIGGAALAGRARRGAAGEQDEREHERAAAGAVGCGGAGDEAGRPARLLPRGGQPARAHAGLAARADEDDARSAVAGGDLLSGPRATGAGPAVLVREILRQHGRGAGSGEAAVVRRKRTAEPGIGRLMELRMPKVSAVRPWTPVALLALLPSAVGAQVQDSAGAVQPLSLEEALERALDQSEEVRLAGARVEAAQARAMSAWSNALPQVNTSLGYTKTLRSVFQTAGDIEIPDSMRFEPDPTAPLEARVTYLEDRARAAALGLPDGRRHRDSGQHALRAGPDRTAGGSRHVSGGPHAGRGVRRTGDRVQRPAVRQREHVDRGAVAVAAAVRGRPHPVGDPARSEAHTSELQSPC